MKNDNAIVIPNAYRSIGDSVMSVTFSSVSVCIAIALFIASSILQQSMYIAIMPSFFIPFCWIVVVICAILSEITSGLYSFRSIAGLLALCSIALAANNADSNRLIVSVVLIFVSRNHSFSMLAKVALCSIIVTCVLVVLGAWTGLIEDYVWIQGERVRHGLGFRYTTYLSHYLLYGYLLYFYIKKGKQSYSLIGLLILLNSLIFWLTDSRNSFGLLFALIVASLMLKWWLKRKTPIRTCVAIAWTCLFPCIAIISFYLMANYDPSSAWMSAANEFLGSRISIMHRTFEMYGIPLFGQALDLVGQGLDSSLSRTVGTVTFVDNSYCDSLIRYGVIATVLFVLAFSLLTWRAARDGKRYLLLILAIVAVHSFIDSWWLVMQYDVFMLLLGSMVIQGNHFNKAR